MGGDCTSAAEIRKFWDGPSLQALHYSCAERKQQHREALKQNRGGYSGAVETGQACETQRDTGQYEHSDSTPSCTALRSVERCFLVFGPRSPRPIISSQLRLTKTVTTPKFGDRLMSTSI